MKKITLLLSLFVLIPISMWAVKAYPGIISKPLPDGSILQIRLNGDEYFSYATTLDGFLIRENASGQYEYASVNSKGQFELSGIKAHRQEARNAKENRYLSTQPLAATQVQAKEAVTNTLRKVKAKAAHLQVGNYPLTGSPKSIVILVNFKDVKFVTPTPQQAFTNLLNESNYSTNGATGSARDYFSASSFNQFSPRFDVVGPYDIPNNMSYYGTPSGNSNDAHAADMIRHACAAAEAAGVDFSDYDENNDGIVDNVFVYFAGHNQAEGGGANTIWPHRSALYPQYQLLDGLLINDYACTSELKSSLGSTMCGIGTFCHEFGHVLGLPDWYDTEYGEMSGKTPKQWSIMDQGSYTNNGRTPPTYSGYERFMLNWLVPEQLVADNYTVQPLETSNTCYLAAATHHNLSSKNPSPSQFFIVENRQAIGWDEYGIPGEGLLITRINYNASLWSNNKPNNYEATEGYKVICAAGTTSTPASNTYPGSQNVTAAYLSLADGTDLNQPLTDIVQEKNKDITFVFAGGGSGQPRIVAAAQLEQFTTPGNTKSQPQVLELIGTKIGSVVNLTFKTGTHYEMRFETDAEEDSIPYVKALQIPANIVDSAFHSHIQVRFAPKGISYNSVWTDKIAVVSDERSLDIPLSGVAPRPIKVVPPVAIEADEITSNSFKAQWNEVDDAQGYYLTVHTLSKGVTGTISEDFTNFDKNLSPGWYATFNTITRSAVQSSPQAALFKTSKDSIYTETYFMPVKKVTFWLQGYNATGEFTFEGFNGTEWVVLDEIEVSATLRAQTKSYDFNTTDNYTRFRMSFDYYSGNGGLAFDDFTAYTDNTITYILRDVFYIDNFADVTKLKPNTEYIYRVKATDLDDKGRYENITDYSNEIEVLTLEGGSKGKKNLTVTISPSGDQYMVTLPDYNENTRVYIYTADGKQVAEINPESTQVMIPKLLPNMFYLLKVGDKDKGTKRKDYYAKFFYALQ